MLNCKECFHNAREMPEWTCAVTTFLITMAVGKWLEGVKANRYSPFRYHCTYVTCLMLMWRWPQPDLDCNMTALPEGGGIDSELSKLQPTNNNHWHIHKNTLTHNLFPVDKVTVWTHWTERWVMVLNHLQTKSLSPVNSMSLEPIW